MNTHPPPLLASRDPSPLAPLYSFSMGHTLTSMSCVHKDMYTVYTNDFCLPLKLDPAQSFCSLSISGSRPVSMHVYGHFAHYCFCLLLQLDPAPSLAVVPDRCPGMSLYTVYTNVFVYCSSCIQLHHPAPYQSVVPDQCPCMLLDILHTIVFVYCCSYIQLPR
jgi:hypothetical protein